MVTNIRVAVKEELASPHKPLVKEKVYGAFEKAWRKEYGVPPPLFVPEVLVGVLTNPTSSPAEIAIVIGAEDPQAVKKLMEAELFGKLHMYVANGPLFEVLIARQVGRLGEAFEKASSLLLRRLDADPDSFTPKDIIAVMVSCQKMSGLERAAKVQLDASKKEPLLVNAAPRESLEKARLRSYGQQVQEVTE